ncbi:calcium/proton antiporter [Fictibacillus macauensis ZFHKF-1]|uniref:Ca(2+)/H(+) antiporter n=1 Tax=Fictibacillus macauensis ZFHKF-1 TaxID=1196324 RepID=I8UJG7_9BACL|nr:calcium/proton antiporter [Fictibacillus macauensis ZFHKF-1]
MNRIFFICLVVGIPLSLAANFLHWPAVLSFIIYCLTIISLASYMGRATESLAIIAGPRIGGLLNATFGNAVELIISIFALKAGLLSVVLASLTGSVLGNLLLVGGLSYFIGGLKYKRQMFNVYDAQHNAALMIFAIVVAFVFPEVFSLRLSHAESFTLSIWVSIIMIILYLAALYFKLVTHRGIYVYKIEGAPNEHDDETADWSKKKAITVLALATVAVAFISESLVHTFQEVGRTLGWSETFIGIIIVAIVGNAAEHASAVVMAYKNKVGVTFEIAVGSTLQIAMFVAPVLVLLSIFFQKQMPLIFSIPELVSMVLAVFLTISLTNDGDTNWFEGLTLLAAYVIMGVGFYLL